MLPPEFTIQGDFPPATYDQWRAIAQSDLNGASFEQLISRTYDGIEIQPLYTRDKSRAADATGLPGAPPFVRGSRPLTADHHWDLRQEYAHPDLAVTNRAILEDLAGGVTSILLRLDLTGSDGSSSRAKHVSNPAGREGVLAWQLSDLDKVLSGVQLPSVPIALDAGAYFLPAAATLVALWRRHNVSADQARGALNADPLGVLARDGWLPFSSTKALSLLADLAKWSAGNFSNLTAVGVDTTPYHNAGATLAQDIAFAASTGVEYLRAMTAAGLDVESAVRQIAFTVGLGTHHFLAIAKLRAARQVWSRVVELCGASTAAGAMRINARAGRRVMTARDPYVNLLRNTVAVFAAGLGGADSITSVPFDSAIGAPGEFSRRIARNTPLVLQEEAHLQQVVDPAGGSWFIERLTQQIADKAWEIFQHLEREGGMLQALSSGSVAKQIEATFAPRAKDIARRKEGITGVSEFPDLAEVPVPPSDIDLEALRKAAALRLNQSNANSASLDALSKATAGQQMSASVAAAMQGASIAQIAKVLGFHREVTELQPLVLRSFAEPFEKLRNASDAWYQLHGKRPRVFLANIGPVAQHTGRAMYAKNFFESGGFEVISTDGFADANAAAKALSASGAKIAVICSSDKLYADLVSPLAAKLKAAGARTVVLAGNPGANEKSWRAAGVDRFIFVNCDVLSTLQELLREEGVLGFDKGR